QKKWLQDDQVQRFAELMALYTAMRNQAQTIQWFSQLRPQYYTETLLEWQMRYALLHQRWGRVKAMILKMHKPLQSEKIYWLAMSKFGKISGFPEWLPEQKLVEDEVIATVRAVYQRYGFVPLETAAVEHLGVLGAKGVIDKEIYALKRAKDEGEGDAELGLHFDLSVPMARYVAQNVGKLTFPFKRYQCQKVWRGDRPQKGRFREFYQFDIDTIAQEELPLCCDAEILNAYAEALAAINIGRFLIKCSNRKVMLGFFESLGLNPTQQEGARIAVDKILKIGPEGVLRELTQSVGASIDVAQEIVAFAGMSFDAEQAQQKLAALQVENATFAQGAKELSELLELLDVEVRSHVVVDLSLARGLDYYTGLVFEVYLPEHPEFGSVGGGGRYD
ncbi:MAG: hypothetical protein EBZ48_17020, partial [Proteobacteria bacterium]|nr:hypothetical protein [Pseudomonadota bacterium]